METNPEASITMCSILFYSKCGSKEKRKRYRNFFHHKDLSPTSIHPQSKLEDLLSIRFPMDKSTKDGASFFTLLGACEEKRERRG
jgi:hypothetical protein